MKLFIHTLVSTALIAVSFVCFLVMTIPKVSVRQGETVSPVHSKQKIKQPIYRIPVTDCCK